MKITIETFTPEALRTLYLAARNCKSLNIPRAKNLGTAKEPGTYEDQVRLAVYLWKRGHKSVFEHVSITLAIEGMSRVCLAQFSRHRIGVSLSVGS